MKKLTTAFLPVAAVCLALPAFGLAGLPEPNDGTIKVPKSIGGVKLGIKIKKADKVWGKKGQCDLTHGEGTCFYGEKKSPGHGNAFLTTGGNGKVFAVSIDSGLNTKGKYVFGGPLEVFQTPEGIGLGDKISKVGKAYPKAEKNGSSYTIMAKGQARMTFIAGDDKHITTIGMAAEAQG